MSSEAGYGRYDKRYDIGPNLRGDAKKVAEAHEAAIETLLGSQVPWLDVYDGDLKREMAEEFIDSLRYGEVTEEDVVRLYLSGEYDVDKLLDYRLETARADRLKVAQLTGELAVSPVKVGVAVTECLDTGFIAATTFDMPLSRSFG